MASNPIINHLQETSARAWECLRQHQQQLDRAQSAVNAARVFHETISQQLKEAFVESEPRRVRLPVLPTDTSSNVNKSEVGELYPEHQQEAFKLERFQRVAAELYDLFAPWMPNHVPPRRNEGNTEDRAREAGSYVSPPNERSITSGGNIGHLLMEEMRKIAKDYTPPSSERLKASGGSFEELVEEALERTKNRDYTPSSSERLKTSGGSFEKLVEEVLQRSESCDYIPPSSEGLKTPGGSTEDPLQEAQGTASCAEQPDGDSNYEKDATTRRKRHRRKRGCKGNPEKKKANKIRHNVAPEEAPKQESHDEEYDPQPRCIADVRTEIESLLNWANRRDGQVREDTRTPEQGQEATTCSSENEDAENQEPGRNVASRPAKRAKKERSFHNTELDDSEEEAIGRMQGLRAKMLRRCSFAEEFDHLAA